MGLIMQKNCDFYLGPMNQLDLCSDTVTRSIQNVIVKVLNVFRQIIAISFVSGINFEIYSEGNNPLKSC